MLNELRTEMANVVMADFGEEATYTFADETTKPISVRIYEDVVQFDEMGVSGTQTEIGFDISEVGKCKSNETVLVSDKTYTIHSFARKTGNIKRYRVV